jgi:dCMP deaminase
MRPDRHSWAMAMAVVTAQRATCIRRKVGAVLVNGRGHVLATGYNGVASGQPHCNHHDMFHPIGFPHACSGAHSPSGANLDGCQSIHAEQNALLQCKDVYSIDTAYVTASPCMTCTKLLLNTSCQTIMFLEEYPHSEARALWESSGRKWMKLDFKYTFAADGSAL